MFTYISLQCHFLYFTSHDSFFLSVPLSRFLLPYLLKKEKENHHPLLMNNCCSNLHTSTNLKQPKLISVVIYLGYAISTQSNLLSSMLTL